MSQVLELAQQGDTAALSALMNRHLKTQGVTAQIEQTASGLKIRLEGLDLPDQRRMSAMLTQGIQKIGLEANVQILGYQMGAKDPAWSVSYAISEMGITAIELPDPAQATSGNLSPEEYKRLAKQGNPEGLQRFVEGVLADKPNLTPFVEFADGVVKVTIQTTEFMDGQAFAADFGKQMNEVASKQVREVELYKRKSEKNPPFLLKKMTLIAAGGNAAVAAPQSASSPSIANSESAELRPNGHSSAMHAPAPASGPVGQGSKARPSEVTTIAVLMFIGAGFNLVVGGLAVMATIAMTSMITQAGMEASVEAGPGGADVTTAAAGVGGVILMLAAIPIILGIAQAVVGFGVLKMKRWAWIGAIVLSGISIVTRLMSLLRFNIGAIFGIMLNVAVIKYLFQTGEMFD
jgi:hypothetical protein